MFLKLFALLSRKDKFHGYILLLAMFFGAGLEALGISLVIPILAAINQDDSYSNLLQPLTYFVVDMNSPEFILLLFILLTIFFISKNIYLGVMYWFQYKYIYRTRANLSKNIFTWYLHEDILFHKSKNSSKLLNNLVNDANVFSSHGILPALIIFTEASVLIAIITLLLILEPMIILIAVSAMAIGLSLFSFIFKDKVNNWGIQRIHSETGRVKSIQQGLGSIKQILLKSSQNFFLSDYDIHNNAVAKVMAKQATIQSLPRLIFETFAIFFFCSYIFIAAKNDVPLSEIISVLTIFAFSAVRLMPSISRLTGAFQNFRFAKPVIDNFYEDIKFIHENYEIQKAQKKIKLFKDKINIKNLVFKYPDSESAIIKDFNCEISYGECIGIIGKSGSGKSTLADIILGLLEPTSGQVTVDGVSIDKNLQAWQGKIGYVPQDVYLLDDSLEANIAFGVNSKNINTVNMENAIKLSQLQDFVSSLPMGSKTIIGEQGSKLSGGQKQRIGIARALYHLPELLIFDEATSALDMQTEKDLVDAINVLKGKITMIVIAHRASALQSCDRLIDMSK